MKEFQLCQRSASDADLFFKENWLKGEDGVLLGGKPKVHIQKKILRTCEFRHTVEFSKITPLPETVCTLYAYSTHGKKKHPEKVEDKYLCTIA